MKLRGIAVLLLLATAGCGASEAAANTSATPTTTTATPTTTTATPNSNDIAACRHVAKAFDGVVNINGQSLGEIGDDIDGLDNILVAASPNLRKAVWHIADALHAIEKDDDVDSSAATVKRLESRLNRSMKAETELCDDLGAEGAGQIQFG